MRKRAIDAVSFGTKPKKMAITNFLSTSKDKLSTNNVSTRPISILDMWNIKREHKLKVSKDRGLSTKDSLLIFFLQQISQ